ncbi:MAG: nucleotidyltransferase domain-containing protein [Candidatus Thermoplasmatota archaeon]
MNNIIQICITNRKIVELFLMYPGREFTINEMSKLSKTPYATTWRVTQKLDKAGLIFTKRIGHSIVCLLNKSSPFLNEVKKALRLKLTPHESAVDNFVKEIKKFDKVQKIILFGSVARGEAKLTSDIDIAVIVAKKDKNVENDVTRIVDKILTSAQMRIVALTLTQNEIKQNKQFAEELKKGKVLYERNERS